jgi:hypothetical protein
MAGKLYGERNQGSSDSPSKREEEFWAIVALLEVASKQQLAH